MPPQTSFARGLQLLSLLLDRHDVRADTMADELDLPVSTIYRYLRDLRAAGLVVEEDGGYRVSRRLAGHSGVPSRTEIRDLARPTLERVKAESEETSLVTVRSHLRALCLDQVESDHAMRMAFRVGQALPLYAGAASRVLLAHSPPDVVDAVITELEPLSSGTPGTDDLPRRLRAIRENGVATSRSEFVEGAVAIAVPVLSGDRCVCSLAAAAPEGRASAAWQRETKVLLQDARRDLESLF